MERRDFLQLLSSSLATGPLLTALGCATPSKPVAAPTGKGWVSLFLASKDRKSSVLRLLNWESFEHLDIPMPLTNPHSLVMDPSGSTAYLFETFGSALRIDIASREMQLCDHTSGKEMFFGHGSLSASGETLFCTEFDPRTTLSTIVARSTRDLSRLAVAPDEARGSHQVVTLPRSSLIACGNQFKGSGGIQGALTFFDSETLRVVSRIETDVPIVHLVPISSTEVVGLGISMKRWKKGDFQYGKTSMENTPDLLKTSTFTPTPLLYAKSDGTHRMFWDVSRKDLFMFNFGVAKVPTDDSFLTGHAASSTVFKWKNFEVAKSVSVKNPMNIAVSADGSEFMVVSEDSVKVFDMETFTEKRKLENTGFVIALSGYSSSTGARL